MNKSRGLGKGLGALIPEYEEEPLESKVEIEIQLIAPNPFQPRKEFSDEKLNELAESIKTHGIIQPLIVREIPSGYQLIAGERRLRAAKLVGLSTVPIVVKDLTDQTMMEIALVENLQREDLNPIEEADAYQRLMNEFHLTQDEVAQKVGKSRSAIANTLRLLNLPAEIQTDLASGTLSMGHARALLGLKTASLQKETWLKIQAEELSVRETEELIRKTNETTIVSRETKRKAFSKTVEKDPNILDIEEELQLTLGTKVIVKQNGVGGKIEIDFFSSDDFERICEKILK